MLGEVTVWDRDGVAVPLPQQLQRLLGLLVAAGGGVVPSGRLADHITDGRADSSAVRTAVSRLRRALEDRIETTSGGYRLQLAPGELDADRHIELTARASTTGAVERQRLLRAAFDLWRGPAFGHLRDEPWALEPARRLEERRAAMIEDLADGYIADGRRAVAMDLLSSLAVAHPFRERPVILLVRLLAEDGRTVEALRECHRFRTALAEVGLEPSAGLKGIEADLVTDTGRREPVEEPAGNIGPPADLFVGRRLELKSLVETVASHRLVTLVGPGGVGKTRLAVEAAVASSTGYSSGAWLIQLASLSDDGELLDTAMTVLDVDVDARRSPIETIVTAMRGRSTLIVLDNAEHLIDGTAALAAALLQRTQGVHLVVTSREPLGLSGEHVHAVEPLVALDSVELFCERARDADDRFECDDGDRAVIEAICQQLDHLPLAIELAAARTRTLSLGELHERLHDHATIRRRGDAAHHATMRATIDWSYQLLTDDERAVFDSLGVFAGSFDLGAVAAVCGLDPAERRDTGFVLQSLANKSMVVVDRHAATSRYSMLETIRQFSLDRLALGSAGPATRRRCAAHFDLLANEVSTCRGSDPGRARSILTLEWDNFRDTVQHHLAAGDVDDAAALVTNLALALDLGRHEHAQWAHAVLAVLPDGHPRAPLLLCLAGWWANLAGDHRNALGLAERGLRSATTIHPQISILLHIVVAEARVHLGDPDAALAAAEDVLRLGDDEQVRVVFILCCWVAWVPRPDLVADFARRIDAVARRTGSYDDLHQAAYCAGFAALVDGDPQSAIVRFREARQHSAGYPNLEAEALQGLTLAMAAADAPEAGDIFLEALDAASEAHMVAHWWMVIETLAIHWAERGRLAPAAVLLGGLEAHDRACVFLGTGRRRAEALVLDRPELSSFVDLGRSLGRIELGDHANAVLLSERHPPTGA